MRIMRRSIDKSFPKRSYRTCFARFLLYAANLSEIKFPLNLRRLANFRSCDSCVEDAVYHHRFETRAQLRYRIKVVFEPVNPLPFLRHNGVKYQANVISKFTFCIRIAIAAWALFLRISSEKSIHAVSTFLDRILWLPYEYWLQNCITTQIEFDRCG